MKTATPPTLQQLLQPLSDCLTPEVARAIVNLRADPETQAYIDELARKSNEGQLTDKERADYHTFVTAIDFIGILQSKARGLLAKSSWS